MPTPVVLKVIVNCAMSADGKIALRTRKQTRISNEEDKKRVHQLRNSADAVLVGIETILADNPKLTVNEKYVKHPKKPVRMGLDSHLVLPQFQDSRRGEHLRREHGNRGRESPDSRRRRGCP